MDEIDFSEGSPKKNKHKALVILSSIIVVLSIGGVIYYKDWNSKFDKLKLAIEAEELKNTEDIYNSLKTSPFKLANLDEFYPKIERLKFKHEILKAEDYFSKYSSGTYEGIEYSPLELDSIKLTVKRIEEIESKYDSIISLTPRDKYIIDILKLGGLEKIILNKSGFISSYFYEDNIGNYSIYLSDSERENLGVQTLPSVKKFEDQAIDVLESLSRNAEAMKKSGVWMDEENKSLREQLHLYQFYFDPNFKNTKRLLGEEIGLYLGKPNFIIPTSAYKSLDITTFKKILFRLMGSSHSQSKLALDNNQKVARDLFKLLEGYLEICFDCPYDEELALYYFNSAGIVHNYRVSGLASYNNLELNADPLDIFLVFERVIQNAKESKAGNWFSQVLYKYAIFLHQTEQLNELAKLSNNLEDLLEEVNLSFESLSNKGVHHINPLMAVYYFDSNYRWNKKDYQAVDYLYEKINQWLSLKNVSDDDYLQYLDFRPSYILRNMWAVKVNLDQEDACSYLRKASDLNPKEFYDEYLKECSGR